MGTAIWNGFHLQTRGDIAQEWLQYAPERDSNTEKSKINF